MLNKYIILISLAFLAFASVPALADDSAAPQKKEVVPANMSDEALASYISGRLAPLLKDDGYEVSQNCDASGCSVVVQ
jgi:hypothetical protein